jgi:hypothetical protein
LGKFGSLIVVVHSVIAVVPSIGAELASSGVVIPSIGAVVHSLRVVVPSIGAVVAS